MIESPHATWSSSSCLDADESSAPGPEEVEGGQGGGSFVRVNRSVLRASGIVLLLLGMIAMIVIIVWVHSPFGSSRYPYGWLSIERVVGADTLFNPHLFKQNFFGGALVPLLSHGCPPLHPVGQQDLLLHPLLRDLLVPESGAQEAGKYVKPVFQKC